MSVQLARPTRTVQVAVTASGAIYAHCGAALLRFKGWEVHAYHLESGQSGWKEGGIVNALVLPESGKGCGRVTSTRIVRVHTAQAGNLGRLEPQIAQMARMAAAMDLVGPVAPVDQHEAQMLAGVEKRQGVGKVPGCKQCEDPSFPVPHFGSSKCKSFGAAAPDGYRAHCTCDYCF